MSGMEVPRMVAWVGEQGGLALRKLPSVRGTANQLLQDPAQAFLRDGTDAPILEGLKRESLRVGTLVDAADRYARGMDQGARASALAAEAEDVTSGLVNGGMTPMGETSAPWLAVQAN